MRKLQMSFSLILISVFLMGCGNGGGGTKPPSIDEQIATHMAHGWEKFEIADYDSAEYYFDQVLSLRADVPEGQLGKGWSKMLVEDSDYQNIETLFASAVSDTSVQKDALAGLGIVNNLQKKYSSSANYINQLLEIASSYVFSHKSDINYQDLLVIQSHSYFYNKQFDQAYESILQLTTQYIFDPFDDDTWIVDGKVYPSYEGAISAVLAKLSDLYKSF
ncbi:MAG: hypothetical protein JXQ65_01210 [Candidatus Marinimicrobia bacterium]|nr:hypothetical protein [Candidatus Neomarinimicrobiota bacterium]